MTKRKIFIRIVCMILVLTTVFSICASTVYAISESDFTTYDSGDDNDEAIGEFESITIDPSDLVNGSGAPDDDVSAAPEEFEEVELIGDVIYTGGLGIRMNSDMKTYSVVDYIGTDSELTIPEYYLGYPITRIADSAFYGNQKLEKLTLTPKIVFVGERVFDGCAELDFNEIDGGYYLGAIASEDSEANNCYYFVAPMDKSVEEFTVNEKTRIVGSFAFENCKDLKSVTIGDSVESIGYAALMQCNALESLTVPFLGESGKNEKNVHLGYIFGARTIGGNISYVPTTLKTLVINGGERVAYNALYGMDMLESLTLPFLGNHVNDTENAYLSYVFGGESYEDNVVPQSLKSVTVLGGRIGAGAFYKCVYVQSISIFGEAYEVMDYAFYDCKDLVALVIPSTITKIGKDAFYNCNGITSATIPATAIKSMNRSKLKTVIITGSQAVPYEAFYNCTSLTSVVIPDSVTSIGDKAFWGCTSLTSVVIPDSVTSIGAAAFEGCTSLTSVVIPDSVTSIGGWAFKDCTSLTSITIPDSVTSIGSSAFSGCTSLTSIVIGNSVESIGSSAFEGCTKLTSIVIPDSVTSIGSWAFYNCSGLTSIVIPDSVISIDSYAFYNCTSLTSIVIPDSVTSIGNYSFEDCTSLTSIVIGNSVESIGHDAFEGCSSLKEIHFNATAMSDLSSSTNGIYFSGAKGVKVVIGANVTKIPDYLFAPCSSEITSVEFEEGSVCESIGKDAFDGCTSLTSIVIPDSVTSIGHEAFSGCSGLTSVMIPDGVESIGGYAFYGCTSLTSITIPDSVTSIGDYAFYNCKNLTSVTIGNSSTVIGERAFSGCPYTEYEYGKYIGDGENPYEILIGFTNKNISSCTIHEDTKIIASSAFEDCKSLTSVVIPDSVTCIGTNVFYNYTALESVVIGDSVTSIGSYAFYNCTSLTSIVIPDSVTSIGVSAFSGCKNLTSVVIPDSVTSIGNNAFYGCASLTSITIPDSVTSIGSFAFYDCKNLTIYCEVKNRPSGWHSYWNYSSRPVVWGYTIKSVSSSEYSTTISAVRMMSSTSPSREKTNVIPVSSISQSYTASQGLSFTSKGDGTCYVSGIGSCTDETVVIPNVSPAGDRVTGIGDKAFWSCTSLTSVVIPDSVTSIGSSAFSSCTNLTNIVIPDSVTIIGSSAFESCTKLTSIVIPDSVTSIGSWAFSDCTSLTSIVIPDSVTSIGVSAFYNCTNLTSVVIPDRVKSIGVMAFYNCTALESVVIGDSVKSIGDYAFYGCTSLTSITIPDSVESIGSHAFYYCSSLTSVVIPDSVTSIGNYAFMDCTSLASITIPDSVTQIENQVFYNCKNLTSVVIPDSVTSIGSSAFYNCFKLVEVINKSSLNIVAGNSSYGYVGYHAKEVHTGDSKIINKDGYLFYTYNGVNYLLGYTGNETDLVLPESYNGEDYEIYKYAFYNCKNLTSVVIGDSVTSIGSSAFYGCSSLTNITIPDSVTSIGSSAFYNTGYYKTNANWENGVLYIGKHLITAETSISGAYTVKDRTLVIASEAFSDCTSLTSIVIPDSVTSIGYSAFEGCSGLASATLPAFAISYIPKSKLQTVVITSGTSIGDRAFYNCSGLTSIVIPDSVTSIGSSAFYNCKNLTSVTIGNSSAVIGEGAFSGCPYTEYEYGKYIGDDENPYAILISLTNNNISTCTIHEDTKIIGSSVFSGCTSLTSVVIPDSVKSIGVSAFSGCKNLTSVVIPDSVTSIGSSAFSGCKNLTSVVIGDSVKSIGDYAFSSCTSLASITIPDSVTSIGSYAFSVCSGLEEIHFNATAMSDLSYLNSDVFYNAGKIGNGIKVVVGANVTKIPAYLFYSNATSLGSPKITSVEFEEGSVCESIGDWAFYNCSGLTSIVIPDSVTSIGDGAFHSCDSLTSVVIPDSVTSIGNYAFEDCTSLTSITIPDSVTQIENQVFYNCKNLTSVVIGDGVTSIGNYTFEDCTSLTSITIPDSVESIGSYAFYNCKNLTSVVIGDGVTSIGEKAFCGCYRLVEIINKSSLNIIAGDASYGQVAYYALEVHTGDSKIGNKDTYLFYTYDGTNYLVCYAGDETELILPESYNGEDYEIYKYAFYNYTSLTSITIPDSVTSIGEETFSGCSSLTSVTLPGFAISYIPKTNLQTVVITSGSIGNYAFMDCTSLTSVVIGDGVTSIGSSAFSGCTSLTSVVIGDGVTSISGSAFYGCTSLTSITTPDSVTSIGGSAFSSCTNLTSVVIGDSVTSIGSSAFYDCKNLMSVTIGNSSTIIGERAFSGCPYTEYEYGKYIGDDENPYAILISFTNKNISSCTIHEDTKIIASNAFYNCTSLTSIVIGDGVTSIGDEAFRGCTSLKSVVIPDSVESVGSSAFYNCFSLTSVEIGDNVTSIGDKAFWGCTSLTSVVIGDKITNIDAEMFKGFSKLISIVIGDSVTSIGSSAFADCTALTRIIYNGDKNEWRHVKKASDWNYGTSCNVTPLKEVSGVLYDANEDMTEFWVSGYADTQEVEDIVIDGLYSGRPVTRIFANAFYNKENVKSLTIPSTVDEIGKNAFKNCINMQTINLNAEVERIEPGIFDGCIALEAVTIPFLGFTVENEDTDYLGYTFGANSPDEHGSKLPKALKSVTILYGDRISASAFAGCKDLEYITLPSNAAVIDDYAFSACTSLRGSTVTDENGNVSIAPFIIPDSVTSLGKGVFTNCNRIEEIYIGAGVSTIADYAFELPLFGIDKSASSLKSYTVSEDNPSFTAENGVLYGYLNIDGVKVKNVVMDAPALANLLNYELPPHIMEIAPYAFAYNATLRVIKLGHVRRIADNAFYRASALIYVVFDTEDEDSRYTDEFNSYIRKSIEKKTAIINEYRLEEYNRLYGSTPADKRPAFVPTEKEEVAEQFYSYIGDRAFMGCDALQEINVSAKNLIGIGDYAFADCPKLTAVHIGANLEKLGFCAFGATASGDSNVGYFIVDANNRHLKSINGVLYSINSDGTLTLEICPAALLVYDKKTQDFTHDNVTTFELPDATVITAIQTYAFRGVKNIDEVLLYPQNALVIGDYAFANSQIQRVEIGENVVSIGLLRGEGEYTVFSDMEYLLDISVDENNEYYSSLDGVLFDKSKITLIKYPTARNSEAVEDNPVYEVPGTVNVIASMAFKRVEKLRQVLISSEIIAIGLEAFYACSDLELIYFDDAYAPVSIMENAFTTYVEIENGILNNPRTQIGYSEQYYDNGDNGEYGWVNYADTYNLAVYDRLPELERGNTGNGSYAVVVVDTQGYRLGQISVSLTDYNGRTETVATYAGTEGAGVAMFYDLFGAEGLGFALDFSLPYSLTVSDPQNTYSSYVNPAIYLDEDMRITYITLTRNPAVFGVSCGETEINTETADINKAQFDYACEESGAHSHDEDGLICDNGTIRETMEICVIAYCDQSEGEQYYFVKDGIWNPENGLYQNGYRICEPIRTEVCEGYTLFYFEVPIYLLAEEVDVEAKLTASSDIEGKEPKSCKSVLNIHVFSFIVTEDDVDIQATDLNLNLGKAGEIFTKLLGSSDMSFSIGKNVKFGIDVEGDTVTMEIKGSKSKSGSYSSYEKGYFAVSKAHNKNTYFFTYTGKVKDDKGTEHTLKYNIRFARDKETENYYYYQCRVMENGKEVDKFYGAVNGFDLSSLLGTKSGKSDRSKVAVKAYLIYKMHYQTAKDQKKISGLGSHAIYAETIEAAPVQDEASYNFNLELSGDLVFKYDKEKGLYPVSSKIKGVITVSFDWSTQFMVWVIPVIVEVGIDASGEVTINFVFDEHRKIHFDDAELELTLDISAYGGIGCKGFSGGLYGVVGTIFILDIAPKFAVESWEVHADVGAQVNALWWTKKYSFWKGSYYIIGGPKTSEATASSMDESESQLASVYLIDTYSLARSEELESAFRLFIVGDKLYKISMADMTGEEGYSEFNYVKLTISQWNGYDWEEKILLDGDNKTNDAAYTIYEYDGNVYILFTQQTKELTSDDSYDGASDLEMKLVSIDRSGVVSAAESIVKRNNYIYLQQYAIIDNVPTIVWAENADNNIFGVSPHNYVETIYKESQGKDDLTSADKYHVYETTANSVWMSRYDGKAWSEPVALQTGLAPITDIALTENGYISYIVDTNSDLADSSDRVMMYGSIDGDFKAVNGTSKGSVTSLEIINRSLIYYYDSVSDNEEDSWIYLDEQENDHKLPANAPEEFVSIVNNEGKVTAVLFHKPKTWKEGDSKVSGSAIYGMFFENGVWGEAVEINAYIPVANYFITEFDAEYSSDNQILLYVSVTNSQTESVVIDSYLYDIEANIDVIDYTIDYANSFVKMAVRNTGAKATAVYVSIENESYIKLDGILASGEEKEYTIKLPERKTYAVQIAEDVNGKDSVSIDDVDMNYSDIQPFGKQLLLYNEEGNARNILLLAIKNTGNLPNTAMTVVRLGNISSDTIVLNAEDLDKQALVHEGDGPVFISRVNENGEYEYFWIVKTAVNSEDIMYFEIDLTENPDFVSNKLISIGSYVTDAAIEKGSASENNYTYVSYSELSGVVADGENVAIYTEIIENKVTFDSTKQNTVCLNYTAGQNINVSGIEIDGRSISGYTEAPNSKIRGTITISDESLKTIAPGNHVIKVTFSDGTVRTVSLSVARYYTVVWVDCNHGEGCAHTDENGCVIDSSLVISGAMPTLGYTPSRLATAQYEYVFVGWSSILGSQEAEGVEITSESSPTKYYAVWRAVERTYTVTWVLSKSNGDVVEVHEQYTYGEMPLYNGTIFTPEDKFFVGWNEEIAVVNADAMYYGVYSSVYVLGDINGDGVINTRDLAMLRQYVVGKIILTETQIVRGNVYVDYNSDGSEKINARDVAMLQQYIAGKIDKLG